jgi:hypothetical protein
MSERTSDIPGAQEILRDVLMSVLGSQVAFSRKQSEIFQAYISDGESLTYPSFEVYMKTTCYTNEERRKIEKINGPHGRVLVMADIANGRFDEIFRKLGVRKDAKG